VAVVRIAGGDLHVAVLARFFLRLVAPAAGHHKIGGTPARKVQGNDGVFGQPAALHEQDLELGRNGHELAKIGFGGFIDGDEFLAAMAHLHHAHAAAVPVQHFARRLLQNLFGQVCRAGGKIEGTGHFFAGGLAAPGAGLVPTIFTAASSNCLMRGDHVGARGFHQLLHEKTLPSSGAVAWYFLMAGDSKKAASCWSSSWVKRSA
jgi:hypothetical protein